MADLPVSKIPEVEVCEHSLGTQTSPRNSVSRSVTVTEIVMRHQSATIASKLRSPHQFDCS